MTARMSARSNVVLKFVWQKESVQCNLSMLKQIGHINANSVVRRSSIHQYTCALLFHQTQEVTAGYT